MDSVLESVENALYHTPLNRSPRGSSSPPSVDAARERKRSPVANRDRDAENDRNADEVMRRSMIYGKGLFSANIKHISSMNMVNAIDVGNSSCYSAAKSNDHNNISGYCENSSGSGSTGESASASPASPRNDAEVYLTTAISCSCVDEDAMLAGPALSPAPSSSDSVETAPSTADDAERDGATLSPHTCVDHIPIDYEAEMEDCCQYVFSEGPYCPLTSTSSRPSSTAHAAGNYLDDDLSTEEEGQTHGCHCCRDDFIPMNYEECMEEYDALCARGQALAKPCDGACTCTYFTGEEEDEDVVPDDNDDDGDEGTALSESDRDGCPGQRAAAGGAEREDAESAAAFSLCCAALSPSFCSPPVGHSPLFPSPVTSPCRSSCFVARGSAAAATLRQQPQPREEAQLAAFSPEWVREQQVKRDRDVNQQARWRHARMQQEQNYFAHSHASRSFSLKCLLNEACRQDLRRLRAMPADFFTKSDNVLRVLNTGASSSLATAMRGMQLSRTTPPRAAAACEEASQAARIAQERKTAVLAEVALQWRALAEQLQTDLSAPRCHYRSLAAELNVLSLFTHNLPMAGASEEGEAARACEGRTQYVSLFAAHHFEVCGSAILREMNDAAVDELRRRRAERQQALIAQLEQQGRLFVLPTLRATESQDPEPVPPPPPPPTGPEAEGNGVLSPIEPIPLAFTTFSPIKSLMGSVSTNPNTDSLVSSLTASREHGLLSISNSVVVLASPPQDPGVAAAAAAPAAGAHGRDSGGSSSSDEWEELPFLSLTSPGLALPARAEVGRREEDSDEEEQHACHADTLLADTLRCSLWSGNEEEEGEKGGAARTCGAAASAAAPQQHRGVDVLPEGDLFAFSAQLKTTIGINPAASHDADNGSSGTLAVRRRRSSRTSALGRHDSGAPRTLSSCFLSSSLPASPALPTAPPPLGLGGITFSSCSSPSRLFTLPVASAGSCGPTGWPRGANATDAVLVSPKRDAASVSDDEEAPQHQRHLRLHDHPCLSSGDSSRTSMPSPSTTLAVDMPGATGFGAILLPPSLALRDLANEEEA